MFDLTTVLLVHVGLCFMALALGFVAVRELFDSQPRLGTELFLITGVPATLTGFLLPFSSITPPVAVGIVSTIVFVLLLAARFVFHYRGVWRVIYSSGIVISAYFLAFVTIAQSFLLAVKAFRPS